MRGATEGQMTEFLLGCCGADARSWVGMRVGLNQSHGIRGWAGETSLGNSWDSSEEEEAL